MMPPSFCFSFKPTTKHNKHSKTLTHLYTLWSVKARQTTRACVALKAIHARYTRVAHVPFSALDTTVQLKVWRWHLLARESFGAWKTISAGTTRNTLESKRKGAEHVDQPLGP